jgi:starch phosphorylase
MGNMKFMMNGAVTLGTEDGANVEIHKAVGDDNIIIFGMQTPEVMKLQKQGYNPVNYYCNNEKLKEALNFIEKGIGGQPFDNVYRTITGFDTYMALADFNDYCAAHDKVSALYRDAKKWNKMSLINIAESGIFAADRSIKDYAENIWGVTPNK